MALMTVDDVKGKVKRIASLLNDPESAHSAEDELYHDLLEAIAEGMCADPAECAKEALKSADLGFPR